jgi:selenocysteine lyase/cysteine desulfurase
VAYFDGPGGTQVPAVVADRMRDYLLDHNANTHWAYPTSEETDAAIASARVALGDFLGASPDEVARRQHDDADVHVSRALPASGSRRQVIVTDDHHANVDPWRAVARDRGLTAPTVRSTSRPESSTGGPSNGRSRTHPAVAIGAASNALGTITDVTAAARLAHAAGASARRRRALRATHWSTPARSAAMCSPVRRKFYGPHLERCASARTS